MAQQGSVRALLTVTVDGKKPQHLRLQMPIKLTAVEVKPCGCECTCQDASSEA
jgi:hypothetical protein